MSLWPDQENPPRQTQEAEIILQTEGFCLLQIDYERPNIVGDDIQGCVGYGLVEREPGGRYSRVHYYWLGANIDAMFKVLRALKEKEDQTKGAS